MTKYTTLIYLTCLQVVTAFTINAQSKKDAVLQAPPADVKVDGDLKEWGDSLRYYNEEKKLFYTLANDKTDIYIALRLNDRMEQMRLLNAGLTLSIDTKGKKKAEYTLTFPVAGQGAAPARPAMHAMAANKAEGEGITQTERDELLKAKLTWLRNIKVTGFKSIEGDMITTTNTYGIKAAVNYDVNGYLIYEACIPFKLFDQFKANKDEWAFNFKINGIAKPENGTPGGNAGGMGGGMRGGGGGMRGGMRGGGGRRGGGMGNTGGGPAGNTAQDRSEIFKSVDFWEKYYLAPIK